MSHILHRDILISTIVACFASAIGMIANIAQWAAIFGGGRDDDGEGNPVALLVTAIVAPLAASIIQLGISRTREYMADEEGGRMIDDPIALARALAKIDNYAHHYALPGATKATAHMCIINPLPVPAVPLPTSSALIRRQKNVSNGWKNWTKNYMINVLP